MRNPSYINGFQPSIHERLFDIPLQWKTSRMIFVNSMSDLFLDEFSDEVIRRLFDVMRRAHWHTFQILTKRTERLSRMSGELTWPPNIWMGATVESGEYRFRIDDLRETGASIKFLSMEPLLGPVADLDLKGINWVIAGGESGPNARPMAREWVISIRDECMSGDIPFFFKQWGGVNKKKAGRHLEGRLWEGMPEPFEHLGGTASLFRVLCD
jgi:protein gp37